MWTDQTEVINGGENIFVLIDDIYFVDLYVNVYTRDNILGFGLN